MSRWLRALAVGLLVLAAGCGGLPTDGVVHVGRQPASPDETDQPIRVLPPPPAKGESAQDIVRGFLRAQADADHTIARRYLAPGTKWDDSTGVRVYDPANLHIDAVEGGVVPVTVTLQATIDRDGAYGFDHRVITPRYGVERVNGQWRLSDVPDGLLLTGSDVTRLFRPENVYFLAPPGLDVVVPDRRFLPDAPKSVAATLVRALLRGPSEWLAPAVRTAVPGLTLRSVTAAGGVVTVDVGRAAVRASPAALSRLSAQLVWTLKQVSGVRGLRLLANGAPLTVGGSRAVQTIDQWQRFDPNVVASGVSAYYANGSALLGVEESERRGANAGGPVAGLGGRTLRAPAISVGGKLLAGLAASPDGGMDLLVGTSLHRVSVRKSDKSFTPPSWGGGVDGVWTVAVDPRSGAQRVLLVSPDTGPAAVVAAPGLAGVGAVSSFQVSRDGTRVAVIAGDGTAARPDRLYAGRIVDVAGRRSVDGLRPVAPSLHQPIDVAWSSADTLVVLASTTDGGPALPWVVTLDGSRIQSVPTSGLPRPPTSIAAAPGRPLVVQAEDEDQHDGVYRAGGGLWRLVGPGRDPTYPG